MLALSNHRLLQWLIVVLAFVIVEINTERAIVQWTPGDDLYQWHMVRGIWLDKTPEQATDWLRVDKPINSWEATRFRSGHFAIEVKACMGKDGEIKCSEGIRSDVMGEPEPWVIFWKPPKPTNIIIEDEGS